jgi:parvulin-like peptidyl-prolyl isomerase
LSRRAAALALWALTATFGCSEAAGPAPAADSALPPGTLARVDSELVSAASVTLVAQRQGVAPREALARLLSDALLASEARSSSPPGVVTAIERAAEARALLEKLALDAAAAGPVTEAEAEALTKERWIDLDRPDAARTTHVVVINKDGARDARARAVAEALLAAVKDSTSAQDFEQRAKAVATDGFDVRVEALPPVTADGRAFDRKDQAWVPYPTDFDPDFSRAASLLKEPGQLSPIVKSQFGYHVIRLVERIPGASMPKADLLTALAPEVRTRRAARARVELLEKLRVASAIQIDRAVDELTSRVQTSP